MKLAAKLLLAPLITAAVALGTGALNTLMAQRDARAGQAHFQSDIAGVQRAADAQHKLAQIHASVYRTQALIDSMNPAALKTFRGDLTTQLKAVQAQVVALASEAEGDAPLAAGVNAATTLIEKYRSQADKAVELTSVEVNMGVAAMKSAEATYGELGKAMLGVLERKAAMREAYAAAAQQRALWSTLALGGLATLATAAALGYAWLAQRRIVREIERAAALGAEVARGNLQAGDTVAGDARHDDEVGALLRSLSDMVARLRESLQTVRQASDSIRTASQEIASGNADLSQRTEQAAGNLQQTASSMAQLTGTVAQTADAARSAHQLAGSASSVAQRGGEVVAQVVATMEQINQRSRKIADIIGTIDGIAFQTNILALNAAVEAARAGEQGRGFAVVAGEVRSLAQRSAEAAREIKSLIQSSVEGVEAGSRQVQEAGSTMGEIVASVQRVSDIIGEISAAAAEQSSGIGQVNQSVNQLDQSTQQNAALVEQSAAAAESLKEQAGRLTGVVSRFQLGGAGDNSVAAPGAAPTPTPAPHAPAARAAPAALAKSVVQRARRAGPPAAPAAAPATPAKHSPAAQPVSADDGDWQSF